MLSNFIYFQSVVVRFGIGFASIVKESLSKKETS